MDEEREWWRWALVRLSRKAIYSVKLLVDARRRASPSDGLFRLALQVYREDPYQRRLLGAIVTALILNWLIVPLGYQFAAVTRGIVGILVGLPLVLAPAVALLYAIECAFRSWVYQKTRRGPLIIGREG